MVFRLILTVSMILGISGVATAATQKSKKYENASGSKIQSLEPEVVKAAPLEEPESAKLRKQRQQMEMETEEKFMEKLEAARMEDEKIRREQILTDELNTIGKSDLDYLEEDMAPPPPVATTNEITTTVIVDNTEESDTEWYVTLGGGSVTYPLVGNLPNLNGAAAVALGLGLGADFWLEGSFLYSFQEADIQTIAGSSTEDIDHYSFGVAPKYSFGMSKHWITPIVGLNLSYTHRRFDGGDLTSNALDGGISGGLDLALNKSVKLGFEGRYMTALDYERDATVDPAGVTSQQLATGKSIKNIEENDYWVFLLNAKMVF